MYIMAKQIHPDTEVLMRLFCYILKLHRFFNVKLLLISCGYPV